jgi:predicted dehydrogenase
MIRIGLAGIGFMGMIHFLASRKLKGARIKAIFSRDARKRSGDWRGIQGNFGPPGAVMDLAGIQAYDDYQTLLDDPSIDLVDICSPTDQHADMAMRALKAGKHVLVEKAIALTVREADQMIKAAEKAGKLLMVAHVLPFFPEFAAAARIIAEGKHGRLLGAHFTRVISKPDWSADIGNSDKTGGPAIDLHIHDAHFIGLIAGVPGMVFSNGLTRADESVSYLTTQYLYGDNGPAISCSSGDLSQTSRAFMHGFDIYLEQATLSHHSGGVPLTIYGTGKTPKVPKLVGGGDPINAFTAEIQAAVDGIAAGAVPEPLSAQLARDALAMCHVECDSVRSGKVQIVR